jgi:hypothetical protein
MTFTIRLAPSVRPDGPLLELNPPWPALLSSPISVYTFRMPEFGSPSQDTPAKKQEGIAKYVLLAGAGCLLIVAFGVGIFFFVWQMTSGPVDVVNEQLAALREENLEKAYSLCSSAFRNKTNKEDFRKFVKKHSILQNAKDYFSFRRNISGNTATLNGSIRGEDGSAQPAEYRLVKEGGKWKVLYINISPSGVAAQEESSDASKSAPLREFIPAQTPTTQKQDEMAAQSSTTLEKSPGESGFRISNLQLDKTSSGDVITVTINFQVFGFANDKSSGKARLDLVEDLQTFDPQGNLSPNLSKDAIKQLAESGAYEEYTSANFTNTLTIPRSYPAGKYTAKMIVHDEIGGTTIEKTAEFEIP